MLGHGGSSAGSYLADPTSPHPLAPCCNYPVSKCSSASVVVTSTVRVKINVKLYRMQASLDSVTQLPTRCRQQRKPTVDRGWMIEAKASLVLCCVV